MAKPTDQVPPFADAGNYSDPGTPWDATPRRVATNLTSWASAGFIPETPTINESRNEYFARIAEHCAWVFAGSNSGGEDAHIVETDASGSINAEYASIGGGSGAGPSLAVSAPSTGNTMEVAGPGGTQRGIELSNSGSGAGIYSTHSGLGYAIHARSTNVSSYGLFAENDHDDGDAALFNTASTANAGSRAILAVGRGDGDGAFIGVDPGGGGYPLVLNGDATSPARASLRLVPLDSDPSSPKEGDTYYTDADGGVLKIYDSAGWRHVLHSPTGPRVHGYFEDHTAGSSGSTSFLDQVSGSISPPSTGNVIVTGTITVGIADISDDLVEVQLWDETAGAEIAVVNVRIEAAKSAPSTTVVIQKSYALPSAATRNFKLRIRHVGGSNVYWDAASLRVEGIF